MHFLQIIIILSIFLQINSQFEDDEFQQAEAEIELANLELEDDCENYQIAVKESLIEQNYSDRLKLAQNHGDLVKTVAKNLQHFENFIAPEVLRNWTLFVKPGDTLLDQKNWNSLVSFDLHTEEMMNTAQVHCGYDNKTCVFIKKGYDNLLATSQNQSVLEKSWYAWQKSLSVKASQFPEILKLVETAASLNDINTPNLYWEMLLEKEDIYSSSDALWEEIKPLYMKLHNFVRKKLSQVYDISGDELPVYLLGSNFGLDWSQLAPLLIPNPEMFAQIQNNLTQKTVKDIYRDAEKLLKDLKLGNLGQKFWANSNFTFHFCDNHLITYCTQEYTELLTCNSTSWTKYLDSFSTSVDVVLRNVDYLSFTRSKLRYSVIDEALKDLSEILAVKNLRYSKFWQEDLFQGHNPYYQHNEMSELLLIALRTIPKLPFYFAADRWRLELLENGFDNHLEKWWEFRKLYQGVIGNGSDFMADSNFRLNKPYLSKFLGTLLSFQLVEYYQPDWQHPNSTIIENIKHDENFLASINERSSTEWPLLIQNHFGFDEVSTSSILNFFEPLMNYLDGAPEQIIVTTTTTEAVMTTQPIEKPLQQVLPTEPPMHPIHEHIEENLEGPNHVMDDIALYIGLGLLVLVVGIVVYVIVIRRRKRGNNRRFET